MTVFCIGTEHDRSEPWTLMAALADLTLGYSVPPERLASLARTKSGQPHAKVLFDGPNMFKNANKFLRKACDDAVAFIERNQPERVCLLGHSRGAVLCIMIAAKLHKSRTAKDVPVLLWLLDVVSHTHSVAGVGKEIGPATALTVYRNVDTMVRLVMEDDDLFAPFPLQEMWVAGRDDKRVLDHKHLAHGSGQPRIAFVRLRGTHGTGSQVNPMPSTGNALPSLPAGTSAPILSQQPGQLWPIGEVCLIHALRALRDVNGQQDGVPLSPTGHQFAGTTSRRDTLLDAYDRIQMHNRRTTAGDVWINDVGATPPYRLKKRTLTRRWDTDLARYGTDFRGSTQIVNDQHRTLLAARLGEEWTGHIEWLGRARTWPTTFDSADAEREMLRAVREKQSSQLVIAELAGTTVPDVEMRDV